VCVCVPSRICANIPVCKHVCVHSSMHVCNPYARHTRTHTHTHTHTHMLHHISLTFENGDSLDLWVGLHSIVADYFHAGGEAKMVVTYAGADTGGLEALVQAVHEADLDNSTALQPIEMPQEVCVCLVCPCLHLSLLHTHTHRRTHARTHTHYMHDVYVLLYIHT
jgi:hypothetical protein